MVYAISPNLPTWRASPKRLASWRVISRTYGDQSFKPGETPNLADEMADVLWVLICLANQTGVDLTEAFEENMKKKTNRDKTRHINNPKLQ